MTEALVPDRAPLAAVLEVRADLAKTNARIIDVKRAMRHRHDDIAWWAAWGESPAAMQRERELLRVYAHRSHVFLANWRGRIHGRFASLDEQRAWLDERRAWLAKVRR